MNRDPAAAGLLTDTCRLMDRAEALANAHDLANRCYRDQAVPMPSVLLDQAKQDLAPKAPVRTPVPSRTHAQDTTRALRNTYLGVVVAGGLSLLALVLLSHPSARPGPTLLPAPPEVVEAVPQGLPVMAATDAPKLYHPLMVSGASQVQAGWVTEGEVQLEAPATTHFQPLGPVLRHWVDGDTVGYTVPRAPQVRARYNGHDVTLNLAEATTTVSAVSRCELNLNGQPITILNAPSVRVLDGQGHQMDVVCDTTPLDTPSP